jgi:hypothetical protein
LEPLSIILLRNFTDTRTITTMNLPCETGAPQPGLIAELLVDVLFAHPLLSSIHRKKRSHERPAAEIQRLDFHVKETVAVSHELDTHTRALSALHAIQHGKEFLNLIRLEEKGNKLAARFDKANLFRAGLYFSFLRTCRFSKQVFS